MVLAIIIVGLFSDFWMGLRVFLRALQYSSAILFVVPLCIGVHVLPNLFDPFQPALACRFFDLLWIFITPTSAILRRKPRLACEPFSVVLTSLLLVRYSPFPIIGGDAGFVFEIPPAELSAATFSVFSYPLLGGLKPPFFQRESSIEDQGH